MCVCVYGEGEGGGGQYSWGRCLDPAKLLYAVSFIMKLAFFSSTSETVLASLNCCSNIGPVIVIKQVEINDMCSY